MTRWRINNRWECGSLALLNTAMCYHWQKCCTEGLMAGLSACVTPGEQGSVQLAAFVGVWRRDLSKAMHQARSSTTNLSMAKGF